MADIFLSYAREDLARIEPLIAAIEASGRSVWYDQSLRAGADFGAETAAALDGAKAVIVVWSPHSVGSKWVRDEAGHGRDASILIPISLDGASPPLGFRQIQTIEFGGWKGDPSAPAVRKLVAALDGAPPAPALAVGAKKAPWAERLLKPLPLAAAGAAALALIAAIIVLPSFVTPPPAAPQDERDLLLHPEEPSRSEGVTKEAPAEKSVAVLPFIALSSGEDDGYFADGLTEEIINSLTTLPDVLVTARTSAFHFKGKDTPIPEIAKTLGVAHVVEGSVRRDGNKVRITAQLIRAEDGFHLWSETYDRSLDDVFGAQTDIAENIARTLGVLLDEQKRALMADVGVRNIEAFLAFRRGAALYDAAHNDAEQIPTLIRANAEFDVAIARQPDFAQAHFLHHDLYAHLLMDIRIDETIEYAAGAEISTKEAVSRLAADLGAAARFETDPGQQLVIRAVRTFLSDDWRGLGAEMDRANAAWKNCRNGGWMAPMGTPFGRAADVYRRGIERTRCDPLVETYWFDAAYGAIALGRADEALKLADDAAALGLSGDLTGARVDALFALGRHEEAARILAKSPYAEPEQLVKSAAVTGNRDETEKALARFSAPEGDVHRELIARAVAGDREGANRIAAAIDPNPIGPALLTRAAYFCMCGAPFDLSATPNFAERLKEGDLPWPPKSPIDWPLKDW